MLSDLGKIFEAEHMDPKFDLKGTWWDTAQIIPNFYLLYNT